MNLLNKLGLNLPPWALISGVLVAWVLIGIFLKNILFGIAKKLVKKTDTSIDDVIIKSANFPLTLLIFISGIAFVHEFLIPKGQFGDLSRHLFIALKILSIVAVVIFFDKLVRNFIDSYTTRYELLQISHGVLGGALRALVIAIGALVLIDSMGVSITPIIASLGIGSLAVALALQPTLENLFSGFQLILDRPIKPGQFIKLESGEEGYVEKVGWRSTWVRQLANNMIIIPNKQLVNSRVLNYYYPANDLAVLVQVGVHYSSDLKKVERVTMEVGEEVMKRVEGAVADFKPFIRYHTYADSSINFTVILRAQEFVANYLIKHEFIKALSDRYNKEGITIPYPIRAINTEQEKAVFSTKNS